MSSRVSFAFHRFISHPPHCLIWHLSKLWSHCNLILFLCHNRFFFFFHVCFYLHTLPFECIFHHLILSRLLFDPPVRYAPRPNSQSPCFYDGEVFVKQRWPLNSQKLTFLSHYFQLHVYLTTHCGSFLSLNISSIKDTAQEGHGKTKGNLLKWHT